MEPMIGQVALVTGAASGLGLATAQAFARAGAAVVLADVNEPTEQVAQLVTAGHQALAIRCDVTNEQEVEAMVAQTVATFSASALGVTVIGGVFFRFGMLGRRLAMPTLFATAWGSISAACW